LFLVAVGAGLCAAQAPKADQPASIKDQSAVERVRARELTVANAAWWGFDSTDSTDAIQSAINSGAGTVIVPYTGREWMVRPLRLVSNQVIVFEPGVVVLAKKGEFHGMRDCLLSGDELGDVTIRGYGATLRMRKPDYAGSGYSTSEFRHVLSLRGSSRVRVEGLSLESSGGDGIYLGPTEDDRRIGCADVTIQDCVCRDNHRQGISVLSAERLTISNCLFVGTRGTAPQAGIDLEPSHPKDLMVDVVVRYCQAVGNAGSGFMTNLERLTARSRPVSITFADCLVRDSRQPGLRALLATEGAPGGFVEFRNCTTENVEYAGGRCLWNLASPIALRFINCHWRGVARKSSEFPIDLDLRGEVGEATTGGIRFDNCFVFDDRDRDAVRLEAAPATQADQRVSGNIFWVRDRGKGTTSRTNARLPLLRIDVREE